MSGTQLELASNTREAPKGRNGNAALSTPPGLLAGTRRGPTNESTQSHVGTARDRSRATAKGAPAGALILSEATVKTHVAAILANTGREGGPSARGC